MLPALAINTLAAHVMQPHNRGMLHIHLHLHQKFATRPNCTHVICVQSTALPCILSLMKNSLNLRGFLLKEEEVWSSQSSAIIYFRLQMPTAKHRQQRCATHPIYTYARELLHMPHSTLDRAQSCRQQHPARKSTGQHVYTMQMHRVAHVHSKPKQVCMATAPHGDCPQEVADVSSARVHKDMQLATRGVHNMSSSQ